MPHNPNCPATFWLGYPRDCTCGPAQTEAFRFCDERDIAVFDLTVITPRGEFTANDIREDSIKYVDGILTCEDTSSSGKLFTFFDVIGYYNG